MTNSTNPAESLGAPLEAVSFYRWEVPAKPIAVHLSLDLIERLERDVLESFRAITKRGSEIGGVLVGRVEPGSPATVVIEQFEPVECEYSRGPLYLLAEGDMARLRDAIAKVRGMGGGLTVAGYFRSNTRRELTLDEDDLAIARELFQDPNHVFLLVRPYAMKPSVGGIFIREDGAIHSEAPYLEFPFKRADLIKTMAPFIIGPDGQRAAPAPPREPLVMPKREASPVLKREELRPAAPAARHEEFPALVFKREERPPLIPASARREEHTARREEPAAKPQEPAAQHEDAPARREERKREDRVVIAPVPKASGPTLVTRHEEPAAVPAAPKPEPPAKKPVEVKAAQPEEAPAAAAEDKTEPKPAAAADTELGTMFRGMTLDQAAEPARGNRKWIYILGALLAVAGGGGYFAYRSMTPAPPAAVTAVDTSLALRVERNVGQILLSWNRASTLVQNATRATLLITDGDHTESVDLDLGQLRTGSIVYSPMTNDVSFRLEITDQKSGKIVGESVRVLAGRPSPGVFPPQPAAARPAPSGEEKAVTTVPAAESGAPAPVSRTEQPKVVAGPAVTAAPPQPESLAARLRAAEDVELPAPPALEGGSSNAIPANAPATHAPAVAPPPAQAARPAVQTSPAAQSPSPRQGGEAREARLIRRVAPVYPALARQARVSGIVRVRATITKEGRTRHVTAVSGPPLLRQAAIESVSRWIYSPTLLNGEPIESDTQVDVNFML